MSAGSGATRDGAGSAGSARAAELGMASARASWRVAVRTARGVASLAWRMRLGLAATCCYLALGSWLVLHADLVVLDALSRSAHAMFVWHNGPPKLAGIGFAWGPGATLPILPLSIPTAFARTGLAANVVSAIAAGALVEVCWRELRRQGWPLGARACGTLAIALQPMIVYYGANGMTEVLALAAPAAALAGLLRWRETGSTTPLSLASFAAAFGMMVRYELAVVPVLLAFAVFVHLASSERDIAKARALAVFTLVPAIYCALVWMYFNWAVQGSPFWFLQHGQQLATVEGTAAGLGHGNHHGARLEIALNVLHTHLAMTPALPLVVAMLGWLAWRTRQLFPLAVAALVGYNLCTSLALGVLSGNTWMEQLRFNMRCIPLVLIGGAWAARELWRRPGLARWGLVALAAASTLPTLQLMAHAPVQFTESSFLRAVRTGRPLTGYQDRGGQVIGCAGARAMGRWIERAIPGRDQVLADDSSSFAVLLYSGHPERFVDRVDHGDAYFIDQVNVPERHIHFVLATDFSRCSNVTSDLISDRYPKLYAGGEPGTRLVHAEQGFRLYRIGPKGIQDSG